MKRRPLPYGFHYNIPAAFDPSVSYDMQYQRLREIVYSIIDNMEIHIPYTIFTTEVHTNDVVTLTGSFYTDHKEVLANKTFSLKGLPDGTYYININAKYKFEPCEPDCSCIKAISPDSDMTLETVYMPEGGITLYTVVRKNGEITEVNYNDIYTGMHNIAPDAHENRFSDVYAKIKTEVDRATAAEETLQHNIDNETARAMTTENVLDEKIKAEQNRATAAERTLQDNIDKERVRAEQAESTLQANITAETNRATTAEDGLQKAIDAERTRAVAAENNLQKNIDNEVANRTAADTAERERAVKAENDLAGDIEAESADRQRADTALDTKFIGLVNAEETRATQAENGIKTALDTEETARINADSKEINDRTAADTALGKRIDTEVSNRTAADTAERNRAVAAEENLQTQVTQLQEAGPGFKQDVFSDVEGIYDGNIIHLSNFKYWDERTKDFIEKSGAKLWINDVLIQNVQFSDPAATDYLKLEVTQAPQSVPSISILNAYGVPLFKITNTGTCSLGSISMTVEQTSANDFNLKLKQPSGDPVEILNVKASSNETAAATYGQVNAVDKIAKAADSNADVARSTANEAKTTADSANATAATAQNDLSLLKPRVDALEANYTSQTITLQAANIEIQSGGNTVDGVNISAKRINGNVYSIMGYFTFNATGSVGSFKIKVPNKKIKEVYHEITCNSAPVDDDFTTLLNAYTLSADGGISCDFGAKRLTTVNIAVTAIVKFE